MPASPDTIVFEQGVHTVKVGNCEAVVTIPRPITVEEFAKGFAPLLFPKRE